MVPQKKKISVAIVGGGIAGMTAALRLAQRDYDVTIYEVLENLGGCVSSKKIKDKGNKDYGVYYDTYPHMFPDWYRNFWQIVEDDLDLARCNHFQQRDSVGMLKKDPHDYIQLKNPTSLKNILENFDSGYQSIANMYIDGYTVIDLASTRFDPGKISSKHSVNGFINSRGYSTELSAELLDLVIMIIWSVHSYQTSAHAYKHFIKHGIRFSNENIPFCWVLAGSLEENLIGPFEQKLRDLGCTIEKKTKVEEVSLPEDKVCLTIKKVNDNVKKVGKEEKKVEFDKLVFAVPPQALGELLQSGDIVKKEPELSQVRRLRSEPIPVMYIYFTKKLKFTNKEPDLPEEHFSLSNSDHDLSILDLSQLWPKEQLWGKNPPKDDNTVLVLAISDYYSLPSDDNEYDGHLMLESLNKYICGFEPGKYWGDPAADIDWDRTKFQTNCDHRLFINSVGSGDWSPKTSYESLPNVFFAGDFVKNEVSMATVEGAVLTGLQAAKAIVAETPGVVPVEIAELDPPGESLLLAMKLVAAPGAYYAKWWTLAYQQAIVLPEKGGVAELPKTAESMLRLPFEFTADCIETGYALGYSLFEQLHQLKRGRT